MISNIDPNQTPKNIEASAGAVSAEMASAPSEISTAEASTAAPAVKISNPKARDEFHFECLMVC